MKKEIEDILTQEFLINHDIISIKIVKEASFPIKYLIKFKQHYSFTYSESEFEEFILILNEEDNKEETGTVRWYNKGKLEKHV